MPKTDKLKMQLDTTIIYIQSVNHCQHSTRLAKTQTLCTNI